MYIKDIYYNNILTMPVTEINTLDHFDQVVTSQTGNRYLLVDFWASWCGPCKRFAPTFEFLSDKYPEVTFLKVNIDECPELAQRYGVRALPTFLTFRVGDVLPYGESIIGPDAVRIENLLKVLTACNENDF
jgi:thioredoxin 1